MAERLALCIGTPRSGTTWLYECLRRSTSVFAPPVKEVRHFYGRAADIERRRQHDNRIGRVESGEDKAWLGRWLNLEAEDDAGYLDMMLGLTAKPVAIDLSPQYCLAPPPVVSRVREVCPPGTKIILMIRNPVDRDYSQANLHFHMHGSWKEPAPASEYLKLLARPDQVRRSDYGRILETWQAHFDRDDILFLFHDEVEADPAAALARVVGFLGLPRETAPADAKVRERVGGSLTGRHATAPAAIKPMLAARHLGQLRSLAERFPDPCKAWLDGATALIDGAVERLSGFDRQGAELSPAAAALLPRLESLGDNCEFGFVLRRHGNEQGGFFRWLIAHQPDVVRYLEADLPEAFRFEDLSPHSPGMVRDSSNGFCLHTRMRSGRTDVGEKAFLQGETERREIHAVELSKFEHLRARLRQRLRDPDTIFVVKRNEALSDAEVTELRSAIERAAGVRPTLLVVRKAPSTALVGRVTRTDGGVFVGLVSRFAPYRRADDVEYGDWTTVLNNLADLIVPVGDQAPRSGADSGRA